MIGLFVACGGSVDDPGDPSESGSAPPTGEAPAEPVDVADYRNVIPSGQYQLTLIAASCDVNDVYRSTRPILVERSRRGQEPGVNIPLPWIFHGEDGTPAMNVAPRQDLNLTTRFTEFSVPDPAMCTSGNVRRSVHIEDIARTSMTLSFESEGVDCQPPLPLCTIRARFDLVERSCDASCDPLQIDHRFQPDGTVVTTCACADQP